MTERRADDATREVESWLKCEYLQSRVGEEYEGVVSAVTGFGLFVQLTDIYIEGLVHITGLPKDYYYHEQDHHRLVGERTRKVFGLGDKLRVRVSRVDLDERKIDLDMVLPGEKRSRKKRLADDVVVSARAQQLAEEHEQKQQVRKKPRKRQVEGKPGDGKKAGNKSSARKSTGKSTKSGGKTTSRKPRAGGAKRPAKKRR